MCTLKTDTLWTHCRDKASQISSSVLRHYLWNWLVLKSYEVNICYTIDLILGSYVHDNWELTLVKYCSNKKRMVKVINNCTIRSLFEWKMVKINSISGFADIVNVSNSHQKQCNHISWKDVILRWWIIFWNSYLKFIIRYLLWSIGALSRLCGDKWLVWSRSVGVTTLQRTSRTQQQQNESASRVAVTFSQLTSIFFYTDSNQEK